MSIFNKFLQATEAQLDAMIAKAKSSAQVEVAERKSMIELGLPENEQSGWKERTSIVGPSVLKNMARKDSIIIAIINTRLSQMSEFSKEQEDRYSPGWSICPEEPVDLPAEDKLKLADPALDDEGRKVLKHEMDTKLANLKAKEAEEIEKIKLFIKHCGMSNEETDTTKKRWDLDKFIRTIVSDRLIYNYSAIELIPTKDGSKLHHFYPVSSGTIRYVSELSAEKYMKMMAPIVDQRKLEKRFDPKKPFRYVQVVRGRIMAAFTEDELIFEPANPTVDPEDNGYAMGELEQLIQIVTAHLFAEAHNKNFFTQGIGTKGILHIKGDNISRAQLEAFKRQWFNQVVSSRNAFRPPIIGMADEVKWVPLAQTNREMEFEQWMNYLIRIACAIYQIDPAEINFDISKTSTGTLNEANNEEKLKASKDKGLRPLLDYVENIINHHILRYWDPKLADKYKFKFVGYQVESRTQEIDRLQKDVQVYKTLNEARIEMGKPPIEDGDIVLNATYTQYLAQKQAAEQQAQQMQDQANMPQEGENDAQFNEQANQGIDQDMQGLSEEVDQALQEVDDEADQKAKDAEKASKESTKKSVPAIIEYYIEDKKDDGQED